MHSKKTCGYEERDESKRQDFLETLSGLDPKMIVYADESGMDSRDEYTYRWNEKGKRFHALKSGKKIEKCWSWLKSGIRHCLDTFDCLRDAMEYGTRLEACVLIAMALVTSKVPYPTPQILKAYPEKL